MGTARALADLNNAAVAGYYPTPPAMIPSIAALLRAIGGATTEREDDGVLVLLASYRAPTKWRKLLLHKLGVLRATSELDAATAMNAAGIGTTGIVDATRVGRLLFEVLTEGRKL
jgi:hypothetical protein